MSNVVMLKKFAISGDNVFPFKQTEGSVVNEIPAGLYTIEQNPFVGYYLKKKADSVELPEKIYGSTIERANRCFDTFDNTVEPLTVGLFGSKGAGKTLLANVMAQKAIDRGMPVIDVSDSFEIDRDYLAFIESLGSVAVLFDEFLKRLSNLDIPVDEESNRYGNAKNVRATTAQDNMLTFLQGTGNSKRITILIDNKSDMLSDYIKDRPGRMRYRYDYECIEPAVVEAVCKDGGLNAAQTEALVVYTQTTQTTFDVLRVIVQEWTFYPEHTLPQITGVLNVPSVYAYENETYKVKFLEVPENSEYAAIDDIEGVAEGKNIRIEINKVNHHIHDDEELSKDEFYESDYEDWYSSFEDYKRNRKNKFIKRTLYLTQRHMIGYSGVKRKYQIEGVIVEIEPKGTKPVRRNYTYNSDFYDI